MLKHLSHKNQKGFTLIELLVVIAIIGILSSVVLASLNSARVKARDARRVSDVQQIKLALELYNDSKGYYPTALTDVVGSSNGASLSVLPKDPQTDASYAYAANAASNATSYHLGANLEQSDTQTSLLKSDRDFDSSSWTGGFKGADAGTCVSGTQDTAKFCYDISNQ